MIGRIDSRPLIVAIPPGFAPAAPGADALTAEWVGGKAAGLVHIANAGLPVPPGFVLATEVGRRYLRDGPPALAAVMPELKSALARLERQTRRTFGGRRAPLLVSVRSGAARSMPGMLETLLDVGLTDASIDGLIRASGDPRFAWDCYRRLIQQFAEVVHGCPAAPFTAVVAEELAGAGEDDVADLDFARLERITQAFRDRFRTLTGAPFPQDPMQQLEQAIGAVFASWRSEKACTFRRLNGIDDDAGSAATVQQMVYGNRGPTSGAGVVFTRDPDTGENRLVVDFRFGGQGEDVVAGRTLVAAGGEFARCLPDAAGELAAAARRLEAEFGDMQDVEFTVEDGALYLLQSRPGLRSPLAALVIAVDLVDAGLIDPATALAQLAPLDLDSVSRRRLMPGTGDRPVAYAVPATGGIAQGRLCLDRAGIEAAAGRDEPAILVQHDLATADIAAIAGAAGVLTCVGARTAHAAVVARQMGKVCLVGCRSLVVSPRRHACRLGDVEIGEGELLTLDGDTGAVYAGSRQVVSERPEAYLERVRRWQAAAAASAG